MDIQTATTPVEGGEALPETEVADLSAQNGDNSDLDTSNTDQGDGSEGDAVVEDIEEVDYEGRKVSVPKGIAALVTKQGHMDADYTRKTQAHAENVRAWEQQRAQQTQTDQEGLQLRAMGVAIDARLAEFANADWAAIRAADPQRASELWMDYQQLKDARTDVTGKVKEHDDKQALEGERARATRLQEGQAVLARDIKDWGPETASKINAYGQSLGFTAQELAQVEDPRLIKVLHLAMTGASQAKTAAKVEQIAAGQKTQPAQAVRGPSGQFQVGADTSDFAAFEKFADSKLKKKA